MVKVPTLSSLQESCILFFYIFAPDLFLITTVFTTIKYTQMKALKNILLCAVFMAGILSGTAQVKQIFKVADATTGKPLADATLTLYGQTLQTNAKGVAVATLPANLKGEHLIIDWWQLDGYSPLNNMGRYPVNELQTSDTLFYYMIPESLYQKGVTDVFMKLIDKNMAAITKDVKEAYAESKDDPELLNEFNQRMFSTIGTLNDYALAYLSDAMDITNTLYNDRTMPAEMKDMLRNGKINEAVKMALEQIVPNDRSFENLVRIARYLDLRTLYSETEDTNRFSDYTRILYEQHFESSSVTNHLSSLATDRLFDEWKEVRNKEKANNRLHIQDARFEDNPFQYLGVDNAKYVRSAENYVAKTKESAQRYPLNSYLNSVISHAYRVLFDAYYTVDDTLKVAATVDSILHYTDLYRKGYSLSGFRKDVVMIWAYGEISNLLQRSYMSINDNKLIDVSSQIMDLSEHLYRTYPDNPMAQLLYGIYGYDLYHVFQSVNDEHDSIAPVEDRLNEIQKVLVPKYPEYFSIADMQITSDRYWKSLVGDENEAEVKSRLKEYRQSHDRLQQRFPFAFLNNYVRFNIITDAYMVATGKHPAVNELADFTEELLKLKATHEGKSLEAEKAQYYNSVAERLYGYEYYEEGISQYQRANDYYKQAVTKDHQEWTHYLTNYLQMGDAYLYSEQYDKAITTYHKILEEEPNIPADVMPQYLNQKGCVYWYEGDAYRAQGKLSAAEKMYKTAEKWMRKAIAAGDSTAFRNLGEMYFTKGVISYKQGNTKKAYQLFDKSEEFYGAYPLKTPSQRYENLLSIMEEYYEDQDNVTQYVKVQREKVAYYKQFLDEDADNLAEFAESARRITVLEDDPHQIISYGKELVEALKALSLYRSGLEQAYFKANYAVAEAYREIDSAEQAIPYYQECMLVNETLYKDTAYTRWQNNVLDIYMPLAACYDEMADVDTANSKQWYLKEVETRDTLTDIMKALSVKDPSDLNLRYKLSYQYYFKALAYAQADLPYMGLEILDKSDAILLDFYNGEYRSAVEEDLVRNYWLRGAIYQADEEYDKAQELYGNAVKCADNAIDKASVAKWAVISIGSYIDLLEDDPTADPNLIKELKQKLANYAKYLKN